MVHGRSPPRATFALALALVACGAAQPAPASPAAPPGSSAGAVTPADVELRGGSEKGALVAGHAVAMDGIAEGLAWPALRAAVSRKAGDHAPMTVAIARDVPTSTVLRAVWTLRDADLRVQTPDATGALRVVELAPKPDSPSAGSGCHVAVFVAASGDLRVASPGGPHAITGPDAPSALARALSSERARCAIRYVAFGAETADAPWGSVFDVAAAVDRDRSAGDARYVLGEPIHAAAR
jgi:hypothetical protein